MEEFPLVVHHEGQIWAPLKIVEDFGLKALDLVGTPRRISESDDSEPLFNPSVDLRRIRAVATPTNQLIAASPRESWLALSSKAISRLQAAFLLAEDPQRRLDAQKAAALMHQMSLVQHVLSNEGLRRVLIADEVGLGKTIEAGMIVKRLLEQSPQLRVLYLAPARLVGNVAAEFREKLDLDARRWVSGAEADARLDSDRLIVASIHRAVFGDNLERVAKSGPWDVVIVDECHHLSDWGQGGGKPNRGFKLVEQLAKGLSREGRLILLSGTPHQGSIARFENILRLLADDPKNIASAAGRVIYRTKDRVRDWRGRPLFPGREVHAPHVVHLGAEYQSWYEAIGALYDRPGAGGNQARAAGWAKGQALQWASSSVEAGVGFLVRLAIRRLGWDDRNTTLANAIGALRPYRGGPVDEPINTLYLRLLAQTGIIESDEQLDDSEGLNGDVEERWRPSEIDLADLLVQGVTLLHSPSAAAKWERLKPLLDAAQGEKVVLFAQPVETVSVVARFLERRYGSRPAVIIGNQSDEERMSEVARFRSGNGPQFLVSSRAGGEGLNMQVARRLIHLDVPWNPMELEQRIGRIHRFGSKKTILVDTLVVNGSREVDMYRIAREKLRIIASQIDPEQFDLLFGRVMSLVPPKELEAILGNQPAGRISDSAAEEIGKLVREGFDTWEVFDSKYRTQADQIRALDAGDATWEDLESFVVRTAGAERATDVKLTTFEYVEDEIVSRDEYAPAVRMGDHLYVCADTGGLPGETESGAMVPSLGMNLPEVRRRLREYLLDGEAGAAYLKCPSEFDGELPSKFGVIAFLRQMVRMSSLGTAEKSMTLHFFLVSPERDTVEVRGRLGAKLVRSMLKAVRIRDPRPDETVSRMVEIENSLAAGLRCLNDGEREEGVRPAVWPVAAVVFQ